MGKSGISKDQATPIYRTLKQTMEHVREKLGIGTTFDVIEREFSLGERAAVAYFVDGFIKDKVTLDIITRLQLIKRADLSPLTADKLQQHLIAYAEMDIVDTLDDAIQQILSGPLVLFVDGLRQAIVIDVREYPVRSIEEPDLEKVTRGSHEGFVETVIFNTALVRRRLRDPYLRFEHMTVGTRSKTDVAIGYIQDIADPKLIETVKDRIENASIDALPMGSKTLEPFIVKRPWNPLPRVRYTERPDVAVAHLLEGHVIVIVDTTPMVFILPVTFFHFFEHAEEFFQSPIIGTYLRLVRIAAFWVSTFLTPVWLALYLAKDGLGGGLSFIGPKEASSVPIIAQFFILELGIDLIRMALIHTPNALSTSLGIVGAILLGDLAVAVGLFVPETILYTAIVAIGYFAIPSIEFGYAIRLYRYSLLLLAALFKIPGMIAGAIFGFLFLALSRSIDTPFLWPLVPFHGPSLLRAIVRLPASTVGARPPLPGNKRTDRSRTSGSKPNPR